MCTDGHCLIFFRTKQLPYLVLSIFNWAKSLDFWCCSRKAAADFLHSIEKFLAWGCSIMCLTSPVSAKLSQFNLIATNICFLAWHLNYGQWQTDCYTLPVRVANVATMTTIENEVAMVVAMFTGVSLLDTIPISCNIVLVFTPLHHIYFHQRNLIQWTRIGRSEIYLGIF